MTQAAPTTTRFEPLRRRVVAIYLLITILAAGGVYAGFRLPSSIFPSVTFPLVKVIVNVGDQSASFVMPTVTRPIEEAILRVPGITTVRSTTSRGSVELAALFRWGTDMQAALSFVRAETERVRPSLPPEATIDVEWMNTATTPIQGYALTSDTHTQAELRALAEYTLKPVLMRIPGVSQLQIQGGLQREFEVRLDRPALVARKLTAGDVVTALRQNNQVVSAGLTERNHELYLTLVDGSVHDLSALAEVAVPVPGGGAPARLDELGRVAVADEVSYVRTSSGERPAVLLNVVRQPNGNTVAIAHEIATLLKDRPDLIPAGVTWVNFYNQAQLVAESVRGVFEAIVVGIVLAAMVLLVFLGSVRQTIIAALAIPFTCAIVVLALAATGQTLNLMTLSGIAAAIGLIADDAIVVIENVHRHRAEHRSTTPAASGIRELLPALVGSSLSTTLIFVPFALLGGVTGAFFKPLALTMALCLVVSFFLAWVAVPVSAATFPGKERPAREPGRLRRAWARVVGRADAVYGRVVGWLLRRAWLAALALVALLVGVWLLYGTIGSDFLPRMDEGTIVLDYFTPPGTSLTDTDAMLRHVDRVIQSVPDVENYSRRTGAQLGFFITEPNRGDYTIKLKPRDQRRPIEDVMDELRRRVHAVEPAVHTNFGQIIEDAIGDLTGGEPEPIDVKIFGDDEALLQQKARQTAELLRGVRGTEDVFDGVTIAGPALRVRIDPAAARYGLTAAALQAEVEPAVVGTVANQVRVGERMYDLRVLALDSRPLDRVEVRTPTGALVPLGTVASITTGAPEIEIDRQNLKSYFGVTARLAGRSLGDVMHDVKRKLASQLQLGSGMRIEYGGLYQEQQASFRSLLYLLCAGVVLVALIVLFELADWRAPILVALVALASLAGVFLALLVTGMTLNISSFVGAIVMVGIVGENAIFVIHEARLELRAGLAPEAAWLLASRRRLRPVAMTIFATGFALLPLALAVGHGAQLMQPLAVAVIGGFVLSGPLVLWALPSLYHLLDRHGRLGS